MTDPVASNCAHPVVVEKDLSDDWVEADDVSEPTRHQERLVSIPRHEHDLEDDPAVADGLSFPARIVPLRSRRGSPPQVGESAPQN